MANVFSGAQTPSHVNSGGNTPLSKPIKPKKLKLRVNLVLLNNTEVTIPIFEGVEVGLSVLKACLGVGIQDTAMIEIIKRKIIRDIKRRELRTPKETPKQSVRHHQFPERLSKSDKKPRSKLLTPSSNALNFQS